MNIDPNAPAYPIASQIHSRDSYSGRSEPMQEEFTPGLTIRAEIASRIMAGMCSNPEIFKARLTDTDIAIAARTCADALITELNTTPTPEKK